MTDQKTSDDTPTLIPVVAIGTSAGGLEALRRLLPALPAGRGYCYVIAQHLSPTHQSMLGNLLRASTEMRVADITDGQRVEPNTVFITPPNYDVSIVGDILRLTAPKTEAGPKPRVNILFATLAEARGEQAIAIVLTGTGSDGADGVRAVKSAGGVVLVQDPATAAYDGMPSAAMQTGCASLVVDLDQIGELLDGLEFSDGGVQFMDPSVIDDDSRLAVSEVVHAHNGFPLSHYKAGTVNRRIVRRMGLRRIQTLPEYLQLLRDDPEEADQLGRDVLISVTSFIRDPEAFAELRVRLTEALAELPEGSVYRVWVAGCATGQEAYSIAMLLSELLAHSSADFLIFASDLDATAIAFAREGVYPKTDLAGLPASLARRYLEEVNDRYRVVKRLRNRMVFAVHNVISDPPFAKIDLVTCRNLLIYLEREAQQQVLRTFHYALRGNGLLFLGAAESVEHQRELFASITQKTRIFQRKKGTAHYTPPLAAATTRHKAMAHAAERNKPAQQQKPIEVLVDEALRPAYVPPSLLIDEDDNITRFVGKLERFVQLPTARGELRAFDMVRDPLRAELRALVYRCRRDRQVATGSAMRLPDGTSSDSRIRLAVRPLPVGETLHVLVSFEPCPEPPASAGPATEDDAADPVVVRELESELNSAREQLQNVMEELESSNEELQAHSEELQSSNEELQSTNEELQTTNEELQSTNEELLTLNEELKSRSAELEATTATLVNIKDSFDYPILVLDTRLHVMEFNSAASRLLDGDAELKVNASLASLEWRFDLIGHTDAIRQVIKTGDRCQLKMRSDDGRDHAVHLSPYRLANNDIRGVVISLFDETEARAGRRAMAEREALYRVMFHDSATAGAIIQSDGSFGEANTAFTTLLDSLGHSAGTLRNIVHEQDWPTVSSKLESTGGKDGETQDIEFRVNGNDKRRLRMRTASIAINQQRPEAWVAQIEDVSAERGRSRALKASNETLELVNHIAVQVGREHGVETYLSDATAYIAEMLPWARVAFSTLDGSQLRTTVCHAPEPLPETVGLCLPLDDHDALAEQLRSRQAHTIDNLQATPRPPWAGELGKAGVRARVDQPVHVEGALYGTLSLERAEAGAWDPEVIELLAAAAEVLAQGIRDAHSLAERERLDAQLVAEKERVEITLQAIGDAVITSDADGLVTYMNPAACTLIGVDIKDAIGQPVSDLVRLTDVTERQPIDNPLATCLERNEAIGPGGADTALNRAGGRQIVVDASAAPLRDAKDKLVGGVLVLRDVTDQRLLSEELTFRATHDPLTGLCNRDEFRRRLQDALRNAARAGSEHAVLYIDLDKFKLVNDTSGHAAGDELLKLVALRLRSRLRTGDTLARVGGDEFAAVLHQCALADAKRCAESMLATLHELRFNWQQRTHQIGASIGIIPVSGDVGSAAELMSRADSACYLAKEGGRDRTYTLLADDEQFASRRSELELVAHISHALEHDEFLVSVESVVPLDEPERIVYRELLIRLPGPDGTLIPPLSFLPAAQRFGMMPAIDRWMVERALEFAGSRPDGENIVTAVNLSAEGLADDRFAGWLHARLDAHAVSPEQLCFEISEGVAVRQLSTIAPLMTQLAERGYLLALDDFGAGSTSLAHLKSLPLSFVKIDAAYTRNMLRDNVSHTLVESVNRVIHELGLKSIAEYVDSPELLNALHALGVNFGQGHMLASPWNFEHG